MNITEATEKVQETTKKVRGIKSKTWYRLTRDLSKLVNDLATLFLMVFSMWYLFAGGADKLLVEATINDFVVVAILVRTMFALK